MSDDGVYPQYYRDSRTGQWRTVDEGSPEDAVRKDFMHWNQELDEDCRDS